MSFASFDPTTTFLDSFTPSDCKLEPNWEQPQVPIALSQAQLDAFKYELASPIPSPCNFFFEIEPDTTKYEECYDEFMETKLSVLQELLTKVKAKYVEDSLPLPLPAPLPEQEPATITSLEELFETGYTIPDNFMDDFMDDFWQDTISTPSYPNESPSASTSTTSSSSSSIATPPCSTFTFCSTPFEGQDLTSWLDGWEKDLETWDNPKDGDYQPFKIQNSSPMARQKISKKTRPLRLSISTEYLGQPFPSISTPITKMKRKSIPSVCIRIPIHYAALLNMIFTAQSQPRDAKRQKVDPEVVCRINGCRHISKTRFECSKHRETHFPGRFQCPHPACRKIFVRSSSLSRHLKRPRNVECSSFAGEPVEWGVGLVKFALHPAPWLALGFLDDITDV
ncbi:hypothetical protein H0H81_001783 [Sphagnurus paluster]|uniref:C2H2-type domain-containing protein n=1 Tax=Sphagnurus paluster TaxID=117069 RepID=A0A9P7FVN3_9AGAR|nr:hypothetical protein H0H81_001783 [Sphagnurus paluster]